MKTNRSISDGAEEYINKKIDVLDHGFVYLVDYMGDDLSIEEAARVSYGPGTKKASSSTGLIRYLKRHDHTSPFEMVELKFHVKMPIFVARQWIRHRTASVNEISGRYSILNDEFYIPESDTIAYQSSTNNQGRGDEADKEAKELYAVYADLVNQISYSRYKRVLDKNIAKEIARIYLPTSLYTEFYWKINLHNLMHFLNLRMDSHAQFEIREYANALADIVKAGWPIAYSAFEDYMLDAEKFSKKELKAVGYMISSNEMPVADAAEKAGLSGREATEFLDKIVRILEC